MRLTAVVLTVLVASLSAVEARAAVTLRAYYIGNSVTDTMNYTGVQHMATAQGNTDTWGRTMIPGAPLEWTWNHSRPGDRNSNGFLETAAPHYKTDGSFDYYDNEYNAEGFGDNQQRPAGSTEQKQYFAALPNYTWDVVTLQPFDRSVGSDYDYASRMINLACQNPANKNAQFYVYSRWPRRTADASYPSGFKPYDFRALFDGGASSSERRQHFEDLRAVLSDPAVAAAKGVKLDSSFYDRGAYSMSGSSYDPAAATYDPANPKQSVNPGTILNKPVLLIPVGDVLYELENRLQANPANSLATYGIDSVEDLFADGIHFNNVGSYLVGTVFYSTMFKTSPVGMSVPSDYGTVDPELRDLIQDTTWDIVSTHPLAGVVAVPEPGTLALVLVGMVGLLLAVARRSRRKPEAT